MQNSKERHPYRVHISGLAKSAVHRHDGHQCYDEEYEIGDFFHNHGCEVTWVSLLVDKRSGRSRGFAFVDFEDETSFEKACALNGMDHPPEIKLDEKSGGRIQVYPARPSDDTIRQQHLELTKERNRTDGLEKEMRLCAARINEKMLQIQAQRERQLSLQKTGRVEEELHNQRARQKEIQALKIDLEAMEASLTSELNSEIERTRALEDLHASVAWDEEHAHGELHGQHDAPPIKPLIAPEAEELHRSISVQKDEFVAPPPPPSTPDRAPSAPRAWLAKREEKDEALKRAASIGHDLSRNILDAKVEALEAKGASQHSNRAETGVRPAAKNMPHHPRWGDITDDEDMDTSTAATSIWGRGGGRRDALVRNLPPLPHHELEVELKREFARLWEATGRDIAPEVESLKFSTKDLGYIGKAATTETIVVFTDPYNAWLLVEHCGTQDWSSSATPTLHGQVLQVEWPPSPPRVTPLDFRKFNFRADTDASSQMSYNTIGTANSRSSIIAKGANGKGSLGKGGEFVPPQNRTVIIAGIPTTLKEYDVKSEILGLLRRLYQKKSFVFDPAAHLHKGPDGVEVRAAARRQDENGGSVKLRLRNYADAAWLVEQASGLRVAGAKLKAFWAQPRAARGGGGDGGKAESAGKGEDRTQALQKSGYNPGGGRSGGAKSGGRGY